MIRRIQDLREVLDGGRRLVLLTAHRRESFGSPIRGGLFGRQGAGRSGGRHRGPLSGPPESPGVGAGPGAPFRITPDSPHRAPGLPGPGLGAETCPAGPHRLGGHSGRGAHLWGSRSWSSGRPPSGRRAWRQGWLAWWGPNRTRILAEGPEILRPGARWARPRVLPHNPYGDGQAGERIADIVVSSLTGRPERNQPTGTGREDPLPLRLFPPGGGRAREPRLLPGQGPGGRAQVQVVTSRSLPGSPCRGGDGRDPGLAHAGSPAGAPLGGWPTPWAPCPKTRALAREADIIHAQAFASVLPVPLPDGGGREPPWWPPSTPPIS